jgi:hypothetical protein
MVKRHPLQTRFSSDWYATFHPDRQCVGKQRRDGGDDELIPIFVPTVWQMWTHNVISLRLLIEYH